MRITFHRASLDDIVRQFRYYLLEVDQPAIAVRFKQAVGRAVQAIRRRPHAAPLMPIRNPRLKKLRSWPVPGFEAIRVYFVVDAEAVRVIRVLHGKRDVRKILERESSPGAG